MALPKRLVEKDSVLSGFPAILFSFGTFLLVNKIIRMS